LSWLHAPLLRSCHILCQLKQQAAIASKNDLVSDVDFKIPSNLCARQVLKIGWKTLGPCLDETEEQSGNFAIETSLGSNFGLANLVRNDITRLALF
jgi:hypothetical protein